MQKHVEDALSSLPMEKRCDMLAFAIEGLLNATNTSYKNQNAFAISAICRSWYQVLASILLNVRFSLPSSTAMALQDATNNLGEFSSDAIDFKAIPIHVTKQTGENATFDLTDLYKLMQRAKRPLHIYCFKQDGTPVPHYLELNADAVGAILEGDFSYRDVARPWTPQVNE